MPVEDSIDIDLGDNIKSLDDLDAAADKAAKTLKQRNTELKKSIQTAEKAIKEQKRLEKRGGIYSNPENRPVPKGSTAPFGQDDIEDTESNNRKTRSGAGLYSRYGYGHDEKKAFVSEPEELRQIPSTDKAPFEHDPGPGFGGSLYVAPRGYRGSKVNKKGNVRQNESLDYSSVGGIQPSSLKDQIKELQRNQKAEEREIQKRTAAFRKQIFGGENISVGTVKNMVDMGKNPVNFTESIIRKIPFLGGAFALKDIAEFIINEVAKLDAFFKAFVDKVDTRVNQLITKRQQADIQAGNTQLILDTEAGGISPRTLYNTFNDFNRNRLAFENERSIRKIGDT